MFESPGATDIFVWCALPVEWPHKNLALRFRMTKSTPNAGLPADHATEPDPSERLRLMKAFLETPARDTRASVIELAERLAGRPVPPPQR
jgi:hypothetical protein